MGNEKESVLAMVADGTITAAEGAKLLEALGSTGNSAERGRIHRRRRVIDTRSIINEIGPMMQEIGPMIQATMGDVFKGRKSFEAYDKVDFEEVESIAEEIEEMQLVIHGDAGRGNSISIALCRSEDNTLRASTDDESFIKVGNKDKKRIIVWSSGELSVQVPDSVTSVEVFSRGGGISSTDVKVPLVLKTMGGGIDLSKPGNKFSIKTMGGGLDITLDSSWKGNSKAKTMGGGISIHLIDEVPILISATTLGGSINVAGNDPVIISESGQNHGKSKLTVKFGDEEDPSQLSVTSMGGGIEIEGNADE